MVKKFLVICVVAVAAIGASQALGGGKPFTQATGDVSMASPNQQASFAVFDYGATGDRGTVEYQNFDYPGGLDYTADVICATVDSANHRAQFTFTIPAGFPGLSGLNILVRVTDGGSPGAGNDTWGHTVVGDPTTCSDFSTPVGNYAIVAGNLVVH